MYKNENNRVFLFLSLSGIVLNISSFEVYWFTSFYERHKYLDILIKIILFIFSIINQIFIYEMEDEEFQAKKKKDDIYCSNSNEGKIGYKIVNGLLILNILHKILYLNEQWF